MRAAVTTADEDYADDDLCTCGHERWRHSIMATMFVDVGCTEVIRPDKGSSYECHCAKYVRAEEQP